MVTNKNQTMIITKTLASKGRFRDVISKNFTQTLNVSSLQQKLA